MTDRIFLTGKLLF